MLGRPRRRGAAPRRILRWLDRRRAHPRLLRASHSVFTSRAADKVSSRPPPSHSPPQRCTARPLSPARRTERPIWAGNAAATGWWRPRQRGSATPRKHARAKMRPLSLVFTPDFALSRLTRYRERRAAPSLLHFRQVHPARTPIFGRLEAQDGARDRPGVDSPRRCGVSARPWRVQGCA